LALSLILFFVSPENYAYSWLFGFSVTFTITIGGMFWVLLHHAINAGWGIAVRRIWENIGNLFPVLIFFGLPFFIPAVQNGLWEWMAEHRDVAHHIEEVVEAGGEGESLEYGLRHAHKELLYQKYEYLNIPFWVIRFLLFLVGPTAIWYFLQRYTFRQEKDGELRHTFSARRLACGGLPVFAVSLTFWAIDFLMALDYGWFSTMWGVYIFAGAAWSSMAVAILVLNFLRKEGYLLKVTSDEHYHLMGKFLFAFTVFWAYIAFSQFFLIWYANITEETKFFHIRNSDGWWFVSILLVFGHFVFPFVCLLMVWLKKNKKLIGLLCGWILFMHVVDLYWIIIPERGISVGEPTLTSPLWWLGDIVALITFVASFAFLFLRGLDKRSLYPWRDPRLQESANVTN